MCYHCFSTQNKKKNKQQENTEFSYRQHHDHHIKYVQHKNVNTTCDYCNFPRHLVAANKFGMRGINDIILNYHYRVDPEVGKGVCVVDFIPCSCPSYVDQLDKYWLSTLAP